MWPSMYRHITSSLIITQLVGIAALGLKQAAGPATVLVALPAYTLLRRRADLASLEDPMRKLALRSGKDIDAFQKARSVPEPQHGAYEHPALALSAKDFDETAADCARMLEAVALYESGSRQQAKELVQSFGSRPVA